MSKADNTDRTGEETNRSETDQLERIASEIVDLFRNRAAGAPDSVLAISFAGSLAASAFAQYTLSGAFVSAITFVVVGLGTWAVVVVTRSLASAVSAWFAPMAVVAVAAPLLFLIEQIASAGGGLKAIGAGIGIVAVFPTLSLIHLHLAVVFAVGAYVAG
jgi:hypothetical protein